MVFLAFVGCDDSTLDDGTDSGGVAEFVVFTAEDGLADNTVTDVLVDYLRGGVWCSTLNGVSFYSMADSTLITFGAEYDIPNMEATSMAMDLLTGNVWVGTVSGPAYYDDSGWYTLADIDSLVHRRITSIAAVADGSIWFGTKGGASRWQTFGGWTSYTAASGLAGDYVTSVALGPSNEVWFATTNGISVLTGETWRQYGSSNLSGLYVTVVYKAHDGVMWCGTINGVSAYDGSAWKRYGTADGLPSPGINDFVMDAEKKLWVATDSGVAELRNGKWVRHGLPDEVDNERILSLAADVYDGILWIGTTGGLVMYRTKAVE